MIFDKNNIDDLKSALNKINRNDVIMQNNDGNKSYVAILTNILNQTMPKVTVKLKMQYKNWLTKGIKQSCKNKACL